MKYKNLRMAFLIELIIGLASAIVTIIFGSQGIVVLAFFAVRPFVLKRENIDQNDDYWYRSFRLGRNALVITAVIIIMLYLFAEFIFQDNFLAENKTIILLLLLPVYLIIHSIYGLIRFKE